MKQFLEHVAIQAGRLSLEYKARLSQIKVDRKSAKDLVTEADLAVEKYIVSQIQDRFPEHAVLGEETGAHAGGDWRWVIDPIDGTTSFVHGQPFYSVSIAVEHRGRTMLAAVNAPALGELFTAERDHGAWLNGEPIRVSQATDLADCVLGTGFACLRINAVENNLRYLNTILPHIRDLRRYGSAAVDLAYVAAGKMDGFWELNLNVYDVAAGMLLVTEAGGTVTDFSGRADDIPCQIVATNGAIHDEMLNLLQSS